MKKKLGDYNNEGRTNLFCVHSRGTSADEDDNIY